MSIQIPVPNITAADDAQRGFGAVQTGGRFGNGTITADGDNAFQTQEFTGRNSLFLAFLSHKLLAAGGVQHSTATIDYMSNAFLC